MQQSQKLAYRPSSCLERTSFVITTNLGCSECTSVIGGAKMTTAFLDRLARRCLILETGNHTYCFKASSETAKRKRKGGTDIDPVMNTPTY